MVKALQADDISKELAKLNGWSLHNAEIARTFQCDSFMQAIDFVVAVARLAEEANHHPDIDIRWSKVTLRLSTHSAGGLTSKDFALAARIDALHA